MIRATMTVKLTWTAADEFDYAEQLLEINERLREYCEVEIVAITKQEGAE